jgi:toxin ParE1/3/4
MKIKLSPYAEIDLQVSINYYNEQKEKLGFEFANEVNDTFNRIADNYEQFPTMHKDMRKAKTHRFPYNIFFVTETQIVYILGIFHSSRNPELMKRRHK